MSVFSRQILLLSITMITIMFINITSQQSLDLTTEPMTGSIESRLRMDLFPYRCIELKWHISNINAIYVNDGPSVGEPSEPIVVCDSEVQLHIINQSSESFRYTFGAEDFHLQYIMIIAFVMLLTVILYNIILYLGRVRDFGFYWRKIKWLLFGLALTRMIILTFWTGPLFHSDNFDQAIGVQSLANGYGYSQMGVSASNLSTPVVVEHMIRWVPGFSLLQLPLFQITHSLWWSHFLVDVLMLLIFYVAWFCIFNLLDQKIISNEARWLIGLFWLAFPPIRYVATTDALVVAIFSAALAVMLLGINRQKRFLATGLACGNILLCIVLTKYTAWPLIPVIPLTFLVCAISSRNKQYLLPAGISFIVPAIGVITLSLINSILSGSGNVIVQDAGASSIPFGFYYWSNLLRFPPFPIFALGLNYPLTLQDMARGVNLPETEIAWLLTVIVLLICVIVVLTCLYRSFSNTEPTQIIGLAFFTMIFFVVGGMIGFLMLITVYLPTDVYNNVTIIEQVRYYTIIFPFVTIILAIAATQWSSIIKWLAQYILISSLVYVVIWQGWDTFNTLRHAPPSIEDARLLSNFPEDYADFFRAIQHQVNKPDTELVVVLSEYKSAVLESNLPRTAMLAGAVLCNLEVDKWNALIIPTNVTVIVFVPFGMDSATRSKMLDFVAAQASENIFIDSSGLGQLHVIRQRK